MVAKATSIARPRYAADDTSLPAPVPARASQVTARPGRTSLTAVSATLVRIAHRVKACELKPHERAIDQFATVPAAPPGAGGSRRSSR